MPGARQADVGAEADLALRRLNALDGLFAEVSQGLGGPPVTRGARLAAPRPRTPMGPRLAVRTFSRDGQHRTLQEVTLVRAVSIVEAFVFDLGEDILLARLSAASVAPDLERLTDYLFKEKWDAISRQGAWARAVDVWKDGLEVDLAQFGGWEEIDLLRVTRHAIIHRLGEVTSDYRRKGLAERRLKALGLHPQKISGLIPLSDRDVFENVALCRRFVRWMIEQTDPAAGQGSAELGTAPGLI